MTFSIQRYPRTNASSCIGEQRRVRNRSPFTYTVSGCSRTTGPLTSATLPRLTSKKVLTEGASWPQAYGVGVPEARTPRRRAGGLPLATSARRRSQARAITMT